ncbi:MAG: flagellar biosynthesis protein FlgD [Acetobacteraceae bacterium]|nr:flagellar biosynthesis protein FlgD [Acetobacteraceae bacterium]
MSIATTAAQQSALAAAAQAASKPVSAPTTSASGSASSGQNALTALSSNFGDFLNMLMTQLKNQDPSSPLDSNQFTQELVSFSGVEQQINTNNSLTQLIQLTQAGELMQGSSLAGKQVMVQSDQIPLQGGHGSVQFTAASAEPAAIAIADASGNVVRTATLNANAGVNTWNWDGTSDSGAKLPDGAYHISVYGVDAGGGTTALPFAVAGTVTGTQSTSANGMQLQLGTLDVGFGAVQSLQT